MFYEGHLPGFSFNALMKKALGHPSIDVRLEDLFARGIDPHESLTARGAAASVESLWPSRDVVRAFAADADKAIENVLATGDLDRAGHPLLDKAEAVYCIIEHEALHHETLLYMWHQLPLALKKRPSGYRPQTVGASPPVEWISVPAGRATLGVDRDTVLFGWDNEFPARAESVEAFAIERHDVTNSRFLEFVEAGGYRDERWWTEEDWRWVQQEDISHPLFWVREGDGWRWRSMFELLPMPLSWPVYVSYAEASAFTRWCGTRLPTEAEFQRAAYGSPVGERKYPWGCDEPTQGRGVFDFSSWDPSPVGSHPAGASAWGVEDLVGNGWEWTSTPFGPFPGFRPIASYPEYSVDFFDNQHMVIKGASPATARELLRPTFRNWFRTRYPYVYATFRCARDHNSA